MMNEINIDEIGTFSLYILKVKVALPADKNMRTSLIHLS